MPPWTSGGEWTPKPDNLDVLPYERDGANAAREREEDQRTDENTSWTPRRLTASSTALDPSIRGAVSQRLAAPLTVLTAQEASPALSIPSAPAESEQCRRTGPGRAAETDLGPEARHFAANGAASQRLAAFLTFLMAQEAKPALSISTGGAGSELILPSEVGESSGERLWPSSGPLSRVRCSMFR